MKKLVDGLLIIQESEILEQNALELIKGGIGSLCDCSCGSANDNKDGGDCTCGSGNNNKPTKAICSALVFG